MDVFCETERLILRNFTADDAELLLALDNAQGTMFYINGVLPVEPPAVDDHLAAFLAYHEQNSGYGFYAVIEKSSGEFIGWLHFRPEDGAGPDEVELGYRLHPSAWGKGYATEGSRALIDKGFTDLGVQRVNAYAVAVHAASRRVMEKAGLRYVRTFHGDWPWPIPGDEEGDVEYAISRREWEEDRRLSR